MVKWERQERDLGILTQVSLPLLLTVQPRGRKQNEEHLCNTQLQPYWNLFDLLNFKDKFR